MEIDINKFLNQINFFKSIEQVEPIAGGYTSALKFKVKDSENVYFVKLLDVYIDNLDENFKLFSRHCLAPKVYKCGENEGVQYYITEFIDGIEINSHFDLFSFEKMYNLGKIIGKAQFKVSLEKQSKHSTEYFLSFFENAEKVFVSAVKDLNGNRNLFRKESLRFFFRLYKILTKKKDKYIKIFKNEPLFYCHSDFKLGNFIYSDNKIYTVDYENTDYEYMVYKLRSDFFEVLQRDKIRYKKWFFIKGFLDKFYDYKIPANLKYQLQFMFYISTFSRVSKRIKEKRYVEIDNMAKNVKSNIKDFKKFINIFNFEQKITKFLKNKN